MTWAPDLRRGYIDGTRGLAVLVMILAHVVDAWTRPGDRDLTAFRYVTVLGGLAAPLFLWLAGVGLALGGERAANSVNRRSAAASIVRRGLVLFVLAFVFRLQAFVLSPGGPLVSLFRVDILNVMGLAIAAAGLVWGASGRPATAACLCAAGAAGIAMVTPVVRSASWVGALPTWVQWYLRPAGEMTTFTLLPWSGFVFAGAATGSVLAESRGVRNEQVIILGIAVAGAGLIAAGYGAAGLPTIYASSSFWTSSPTYFAMRVGIVMLALALMFLLTMVDRGHGPVLTILERLGRGSLFVYWIHVELVYGYLTWSVHRALSIWAVLPLYLAFSAVMYGALQLYGRAGWRPRPVLNRARTPRGVLQG